VTEDRLKLAVLLDMSRHQPLGRIGRWAKKLEDTGVVDDVLITDQLTSWWPLDMWDPKYTPNADRRPDVDSFADSFILGALSIQAAPDLGVHVSTDSVRRGPAELVQTMLTLGNLAGGRTPVVQMGAGERKQARPFGWNRSQGVKRYEDHLRFVDAFRRSEGPIDLEGNFWSFKQAWMGGAKEPGFQIWGLGGGPRLIDITTSYADGFATAIPSVWPNAEVAADSIKNMKQQLESKGRDPESFEFGVWANLILHDEGDDDHVEAAFASHLLRWHVATQGRMNQNDWDAEGIEPVMPRDWHYAMKLEPVRWTAAEAVEVTSRVSDEMIRKGMIVGTPEEVAARLQGYVDAGVTWINVTDLSAALMTVKNPLGRTIEVCQRLKGIVPASVSAS
jgi:phthiodiolone/phenolphthiodiolone dimycocerosates ketoreductase